MMLESALSFKPPFKSAVVVKIVKWQTYHEIRACD